ncbi:MAG: type II toxin-antitoxin system MqsA family antitoxin [Gemmatimonadaceae bacterium]|nr:type II toxin-antitoxin system MqsA family antitoxin [Gemmatimonadaceae bacterium]
MQDRTERPDVATAATADAQHPAHLCADNFDLVHRAGTRMTSGVEIPVQESLYKCRVCGAEEYSLAQAEAAQRVAATHYRELYGFLQPDEILALRKRLGLTQAYLERILGLGRKTVARWEAGRVLQSRAMDNLLRAILHVPDLLDFFALRAGLGIINDVAESPTVADTSLESIGQQRQNAESKQVPVDTYTTAHLTVHAGQPAIERDVTRRNVRVTEPASNLKTWVLPAKPENEPWLTEHRAIHPAYASAG